MSDLRKRLYEIGSLNFGAQYLQIPKTNREQEGFWGPWPLEILRMQDNPPYRDEAENREWLLEAFFDEEPIPVDIEAAIAVFAANLAKVKS